MQLQNTKKIKFKTIFFTMSQTVNENQKARNNSFLLWVTMATACVRAIQVKVIHKHGAVGRWIPKNSSKMAKLHDLFLQNTTICNLLGKI